MVGIKNDLILYYLFIELQNPTPPLSLVHG